jgi:hypothetical protein
MLCIKNSNWISHLFWFGAEEVGIEPKEVHIFPKKQKQWRSSYAAPQAEEPKAMNLKELVKCKSI